MDERRSSHVVKISLNVKFFKTHVTLITLIQDKKISGRTLEKDLNFTNMKNYRVFGTIDFRSRERLIYQIHRLTKKQQKSPKV